MPRNVRNFWIEGQVDGYKDRIGMGPKSKEGGFHLNLSIRYEGSVRPILSIEGCVDGDVLHLSVLNKETGCKEFEVTTHRTKGVEVLS